MRMDGLSSCRSPSPEDRVPRGAAADGFRCAQPILRATGDRLEAVRKSLALDGLAKAPPVDAPAVAPSSRFMSRAVRPAPAGGAVRPDRVVVFFLVPLALAVMVSFWRLQPEYPDLCPAFTVRGYVEIFRGLHRSASRSCASPAGRPTCQTLESSAMSGVADAHSSSAFFVALIFLAFHVRSATVQIALFLVYAIPFLDGLERHPHHLVDSAARPQRPHQRVHWSSSASCASRSRSLICFPTMSR